jgi:hypothetical protein
MSRLRVLALFLSVISLSATGCGTAPDDGEGGSTSSELGGSEDVVGSEGEGSDSDRKLRAKGPVERAPYSVVPQDAVRPTDPSPWKSPGPPR